MGGAPPAAASYSTRGLLQLSRASARFVCFLHLIHLFFLNKIKKLRKQSPRSVKEAHGAEPAGRPGVARVYGQLPRPEERL